MASRWLSILSLKQVYHAYLMMTLGFLKVKATKSRGKQYAYIGKFSIDPRDVVELKGEC